MSYFWDNRDEIYKKACNRYQDRGAKEKAAKYYKKNGMKKIESTKIC